jgi:hypothetical protein
MNANKKSKGARYTNRMQVNVGLLVHIGPPSSKKIPNCLARSSNSETASNETFVLDRRCGAGKRLVADTGMRNKISLW